MVKKMANNINHAEFLQRLEQTGVHAAEQAVIDSIPKELLETMRKADEEFKAKGGCPGCGSKLLAVHYGNCPELENDIF